jgi:hypothetical protein
MINLKELISSKPYFEATLKARSLAKGEAYEEAGFEKLQRLTYLCLRLVMLVIAILLPIVFLVSSFWVGMQSSISAFYHTDMRNVFVGSLFAIGICLYIYKGYNNLEDNGLTVAGLFLFGVALFPIAASDGSSSYYFDVIHKICACVFFGLIAVVCIFARPNGLTTASEYSTAYNITACLMILVLAGALVLYLIDKFWHVQFRYSTFCVETAAVWVFAWYWRLKSRELHGLG